MRTAVLSKRWGRFMRESNKKKLFKKATVYALSFLMAFGPFMSSAYAAEAASQLADAESYYIDADGNATDADGNPVDLESILSGAESADSEEAVDESASDATSVEFGEAVEYVYVESTMVGGGETQNIVVGASEAMQAKGVVSMAIELVNTDTGVAIDVESSDSADGAYLFSHEFTDEDAGAYSLQKISFACEDGTYETDMASADITSVSVDEDENVDVNGEVETVETDATESGVAHYGFDVVRADTAAALREANEQSEDGEVNALTVTEDGDLVAASSVEEAIANSGADTEELAVADESIDVTQEEFETLSEEALVEQEAAPDETGVVADTTEANAETPVESVDAGEVEGAEVETTAPAAEVLDDDGEVVGTYGDNPVFVFFSNVWQGVRGLFSAIFMPTKAYAAVSAAPENYLVVAIDPGHGGSDSGATGNGLYEKNLTLSISNYMKAKLANYTGVSTYMTRTGDTYVGLQERVDNAVAMGADVFVSVHINSGGGYGVEVYVPNNSSYLKDSVAVPGQQLGSKVLANLVKLGFTNRGTKYDVYESNGNKLYYPDGSRADAFAVIRYSRAAGIPGILVECGFIDNSSDAAKLKQTSYQKSMGEAIADGVVSQYGLVTASSAKSSSLVGVTANVAKLGWLTQVYDQKVAGTTGKSFALYGLQVQLQNAAASAGGVQYRVNSGTGWQSWVSNGATAGTAGTGSPLQAIQIQLTGDAASKYDIYYRVHVANIGWMGWTKNGASAGTSGYGNQVEAVQVTVVSKGAVAPGSTASSFMDKGTSSGPSIVYTSHYQNRGWIAEANDGASSGTAGSGLRLEALKASVSNSVGGGVQLRAHVQNVGWQNWTTDTAGTTGKALRIEAIQAKLTGEMANQYDLYYRVYVQGSGWLGWAKNGESAGTQGLCKQIESVQMQLVKKGGSAPSGSGSAFLYAEVSYQAHVQNVGWQSAASNGGTAGTSGKGLRMEALKINLGSNITDQYSGSIQYRAHVQNIGWQGWVSNGALAGTSGKGLRMEAVQIKLTGDVANAYDVYYRAHVQNVGWQNWVKNGETAGTEGRSLRIEAIEIKLVKKTTSSTTTTTTTTTTNPLVLSAPTASATTVSKGTTVTWTKNVSGDTTGATYTYLYRRGTTGTTTRTSTASLKATEAGMYQVAVEAVQNGKTTTSAWTTIQVTSEPIMGTSKVTKDKMKTYWESVYKSRGYTYPSVYASKGAATLSDFIDQAYAQAEKEGVRADVLLAQIALETNWLQFGGDVKADQCNFGGIGATGNGNSGNTFSSVSEGLLASVQHLKAYGSSEALKTECVDPRFKYVTRNSAPYVEQLAGKWASDADYGIKIDNILNAFYA
jgi:uncharacterized protein YjdB/N-acetylmuramoyl-L-alanine amidase